MCHSIIEARLDGNGSYTIRRPALLVKENGAAVRDAPDLAILADLSSHRRAMMRPLLKTSEFCATCHRSHIMPWPTALELALAANFKKKAIWEKREFRSCLRIMNCFGTCLWEMDDSQGARPIKGARPL